MGSSVSGDVSVSGNVGVGLTLGGIPTDFSVDTGANGVKLSVDTGDKGVDATATIDIKGIPNHVTLDTGDKGVTLNGLDRIHAGLSAAVTELAPMVLRLLWEQIPLVRIGMPHRYKLGFHVLGHELCALTFCGESEVVTERSTCDAPPPERPGHWKDLLDHVLARRGKAAPGALTVDDVRTFLAREGAGGGHG